MGDFVCSNLSSLANGTRLASVSKPRAKRKPWISQWPGMIWITAFRSVMVVQMVKNPPAMQETQVQSLGWKSPWRRAWQPTPISLLRKCYGQRSLVGSWSHGESNTFTTCPKVLKLDFNHLPHLLLTVLDFRILWRGGVCVWKRHPFFLSVMCVKPQGKIFLLFC